MKKKPTVKKRMASLGGGIGLGLLLFTAVAATSLAAYFLLPPWLSSTDKDTDTGNPNSGGTTPTTPQEIWGTYHRPIDDWHAPDKLVLKEDGNFTLTAMIGTASGRYRIEGDKITFYELRLVYAIEGVVKGKIEENQITIRSDDCAAGCGPLFKGTWGKV